MRLKTKEKLDRMKEKVKETAKSLFGVGRISMMRVITFFVVIDIMGVWTISCFRHGFDIQEIPAGVAGIFAAVVVGKMGQRFAENGGEKKPKEEESS